MFVRVIVFLQIVVRVPPVVQAVPSEGVISTRNGNDVTLRCSGKGNPNPRITWHKQVRHVEIS